MATTAPSVEELNKLLEGEIAEPEQPTPCAITRGNAETGVIHSVCGEVAVARGSYKCPAHKGSANLCKRHLNMAIAGNLLCSKCVKLRFRVYIKFIDIHFF